jgi:uncharacterized protein (TIGR03435 family)
VRPDQITGPEWLSNEVYDMEGKSDRTCTADELHLMLQHLLEEQFHIKMHRESKQVVGYKLVVEPGGHKLADHDPADAVMLRTPGQERRYAVPRLLPVAGNWAAGGRSDRLERPL